MTDARKPYPVVPGLTDARRAELQNIIADRRQKYPVSIQLLVWFFLELPELSEKIIGLGPHPSLLSSPPLGI